MKVWDRIKGAFIYTYTPVEVGKVWDDFTPQSQIDSLFDQIQGSSVPAVSACVERISRTIASCRFRVAREGELDLEHAVAVLLADPSPIFDSRSFYDLIARRLLLHRQVWVVRERIGPRDYLWIGTDVKPSAEDELEVDVLQRNAKTIKQRFVADQVLRLYWNGPDAKTATGVDSFTQTYRRLLTRMHRDLTDGFQGSGWIRQPDKDQKTLDPETVSKMLDKLRTAGRTPGSTPYLGSLEYNDIAPVKLDGEVVKQLDALTSQVCIHFGVPRPLIHSEGGRLNTAIGQHWESFLQGTILPACDSLASQLGWLLLTRPERTRYEIVADLSRIAFAGPGHAADFATRMGQSGVVTINEIRQAISGVLPLPAREDGDRFPDTAGAPPTEAPEEEQTE